MKGLQMDKISNMTARVGSVFWTSCCQCQCTNVVRLEYNLAGNSQTKVTCWWGNCPHQSFFYPIRSDDFSNLLAFR